MPHKTSSFRSRFRAVVGLCCYYFFFALYAHPLFSTESFASPWQQVFGVGNHPKMRSEGGGKVYIGTLAHTPLGGDWMRGRNKCGSIISAASVAVLRAGRASADIAACVRVCDLQTNWPLKFISSSLPTGYNYRRHRAFRYRLLYERQYCYNM